MGFPPSTTTTTTAAPDDGSFLRFFHIIPRPDGRTHCLITSHFLQWLHGVSRVLERMHRHSVQQHWLLGCSAFMIGSVACYTLDGPSFGMTWLQRDCYTLIFLFEAVFFGAFRCFCQGLHHLSSSSSWPSHVRKVPFLPLLSRHAYDLIRRWLSQLSFCLAPVTKMLERRVSHWCT